MSAVLEIAKLVVKEVLRKKDFYVAFVLTAVILGYAAQLKFYDVANAHRYLLDIGLGLSFLFAVVLTVALAARQFPSELQNRTCHVLWAKPVSRGQFILGKFLGSFAAGMTCFTLFFAALIGVALTKTTVPVVTALETYLLFGFCLMMLTALAGTLSYFVSTTITVSLTLFLFGFISLYGFFARESARHLEPWLRVPVEAMYYLAPHFEFFDMRQRFIHGGAPIGADVILFLAGYAALYSAIYLWIGWLRLRERSIS